MSRVPQQKTQKMAEIERQLGEPLAQYLSRRYIERWETITKIAQDLNVDYSQMRLWFKFFGISPRGTGRIRRIERIGLTQTQKQIVYGSILGDGHLFKSSGNTQYSFSEKHSEKQKTYLTWKGEQLKSLSPLLLPVKDKSAFVEDMWLLQTSSSEFFTALREECYPEGTKIIPRSLLDRLTSLGLAVWFMDDGTLYKESWCKGRGNSQYIEWRLHTNGFSREDLGIAIGYFRDVHRVSPTIMTTNILRFKASDTRRLMDITQKSFPECMRYKLTC